jgi:hypothetical protein
MAGDTMKNPGISLPFRDCMQGRQSLPRELTALYGL